MIYGEAYMNIMVCEQNNKRAEINSGLIDYLIDKVDIKIVKYIENV